MYRQSAYEENCEGKAGILEMILAVDIGNTNIVIGCIEGSECVFVERLSTVRTKTELEYAIDMYWISTI